MHSPIAMISLLLIALNTITCEEKCNFSMYCLADKNATCMSVSQTDAFGLYRVGFRSCENQRESFCNVYDGFIEPSNFNTQCEERPKEIPSYPGGKCKDDSGCLYGICINHICKDSEKDKDCIRDENCPIGTACMEGDKSKGKQCLALKDYFEQCTKSTECKFNYFCGYGHCMNLFDIEDGSNITEHKTNNLEELNVICKSGFAAQVNGDFYCLSMLNVGNIKGTCKEDCQYIVKGLKQTIPNTCKCGFNNERSKHCILGSGEEPYREYIKLKTELFVNESFSQYCHTLERFNEGYCVEKIKTDRSIATRKKIQEYNNKRIVALEYHRLIDAEECIKSVVFDYDISPIVPDQRQCAAYSCNKTLDYCLYGTNPLNDEGNNVKIVLNEAKCQSNETCTVDHRKGIDFIYENYTMTGKCLEKTEEIVRLPGEDCTKPEDCLNTNCDRNNKCAGQDYAQNCTTHIDCLKGLYCDNGKCQKQRKEGELCESGWDCINTLGCYSIIGSTQSMCMDFGSVGDIDISKIISKWPMNSQVHRKYNASEVGTALMCKTGQLSVTKTRCGEYVYDSSYPQMTNVNQDNLIECKADSYCHYVDNYRANLKLKCECGYNSEGKGYCPLPNTINKEVWLKMYDFQRELTDNQCHTLSRFDCYLNQKTKEIIDLEFKTIKAHLFYKAVPCAMKVLSAYRSIVSYLLLLLLALFVY